MTEEEWRSCTDPTPMLEFLRGKASDRKLRLTACGYCRSVWRLMGKASRKAVLLGERMGDESVNENHRKAVVRAAINSVCRFEEGAGDFFMAADRAYRIPRDTGAYAVEWTIGNWLPPVASGVPIVRDIFGIPFRPVTINPTWLTWNDDMVQKIAQAIYEDRASDRMPILADALEEAGCSNRDILGHCRSGGEHVRGCWIVDRVLGKE